MDAKDKKSYIAFLLFHIFSGICLSYGFVIYSEQSVVNRADVSVFLVMLIIPIVIVISGLCAIVLNFMVILILFPYNYLAMKIIKYFFIGCWEDESYDNIKYISIAQISLLYIINLVIAIITKTGGLLQLLDDSFGVL